MRADFVERKVSLLGLVIVVLSGFFCSARPEREPAEQDQAVRTVDDPAFADSGDGALDNGLR